MKESVFGEKETENLNVEYGKLPVQPERVEQAVLYYISGCCKTSTLDEKNHSKRENFFDKLKQLRSEERR